MEDTDAEAKGCSGLVCYFQFELDEVSQQFKFRRDNCSSAFLLNDPFLYSVVKVKHCNCFQQLEGLLGGRLGEFALEVSVGSICLFPR